MCINKIIWGSVINQSQEHLGSLITQTAWGKIISAHHIPMRKSESMRRQMGSTQTFQNVKAAAFKTKISWYVDLIIVSKYWLVTHLRDKIEELCYSTFISSIVWWTKGNRNVDMAKLKGHSGVKVFITSSKETNYLNAKPQCVKRVSKIQHTKWTVISL